MLARTITVPRSTGPTLPGIAIASPARPPSNGPVSETVPLSATGASPLPASALTDADARVGRARAGVRLGVGADRDALQAAGEPGRELGRDPREVLGAVGPRDLERDGARRPPGRGRGRRDAQGGGKAAAVQVPPCPSASIVKLASAVLGAVPLHGVSVAVERLVPHAAGLASTAFGPPWNVSANDVNGTCGRLSNIVVICPVAGSRRTSPASATFTPLPATSM